ncbi:cytochrome c biogenesis protein ResB [Geomonas silvestris]|uniref:Cytochrome c biogenesis protein ResB n=1 Tax=Geomonas silvestris TaxID=2740184 RepID=A0A6V8MKE4_9BACT|nr:cytochrome c biogenesis protein ResB [Geomonas silvestris]GFO60481.1 cytochrome c biogenesis protein ResB [Geomonas silvestris]
MKRLKRLMTARRLSLGLILGSAALLYLSTVIPQQVEAAPGALAAWRAGHRGLLWLVDLLRLHNIYAQPWFAALNLFAALSLALSSWDQFAAARRRLAADGSSAAELCAESVPLEKLYRAARAHGYRPLATAGAERVKCVKYPWGYFGNLLLHLGIALAIFASSVVALTGRQGSLVLVEGEQREPQEPWLASEAGALAAPLRLPGGLRLNRVRVGFDRLNQASEVTSELTLTEPGGRSVPLSAAINRIERYGNLRIYHSAQYGDAFSLTLTGADGAAHTVKIAVQQPVSLAEAGYSDDLATAWSPYLLSAKSFADVKGRSMTSGNPLVVLRLMNGAKEVARTSLTLGATGTLGEYRVRLDGVEKWAKLIVVDLKGMEAVFAGFAVIILGGLIHYLMPPRELFGVREADGSYRVYWRTTAFGECFAEERDRLAAALRKGQR